MPSLKSSSPYLLFQNMQASATYKQLSSNFRRTFLLQLSKLLQAVHLSVHRLKINSQQPIFKSNLYTRNPAARTVTGHCNQALSIKTCISRMEYFYSSTTQYSHISTFTPWNHPLSVKPAAPDCISLNSLNYCDKFTSIRFSYYRNFPFFILETLAGLPENINRL